MRVELWEVLALQFYTGSVGARSGGASTPRRALGPAAGRCCLAAAASSAKRAAGAQEQKHSGMFGPRSAVQRVPSHKEMWWGWRIGGLTGQGDPGEDDLVGRSAY